MDVLIFFIIIYLFFITAAWTASSYMLSFSCQTTFFCNFFFFVFIARNLLGWEGKERKRKSRLKVSGQCSKGEQIVFAFLAHLSIRFKKKKVCFSKQLGYQELCPCPSSSLCATKKNFLHKQGMLIVSLPIQEMEQGGAWWRDIIRWTPACTPALTLRKVGFTDVLECKSTVSSGSSQ